MRAGVHQMGGKLHTLHRDLFYPAFLGAVLFEFSRSIISDWNAGIHWLWFFSALWFIAYFSAAFLSLDRADRKDFGVIPFFANFSEIGLILYISISIALVKY